MNSKNYDYVYIVEITDDDLNTYIDSIWKNKSSADLYQQRKQKETENPKNGEYGYVYSVERYNFYTE